jgi:hypothetical protein
MRGIVFWAGGCSVIGTAFLYQRKILPTPIIVVLLVGAYLAFTITSAEFTDQANAHDAQFISAQIRYAKILEFNQFTRGPIQIIAKLKLDNGNPFSADARYCKLPTPIVVGANITLEQSTEGELRLAGCKFVDQLGFLDRRKHYL